MGVTTTPAATAEPTWGPWLASGHWLEREILASGEVPLPAENRVNDADSMHARFYNPQLGRFLSVDPAGYSARLVSPQTWNRYAYVTNNPLRFIDPDGRDRQNANTPVEPKSGLGKALRNERARSIGGFLAAKGTEAARQRMEPGPMRGAVTLAGAGFAMDSAFKSLSVSIGSFVVAGTTAKTGVGVAVGIGSGVFFGGLMVADVLLAAELIESAAEDFRTDSDAHIQGQEPSEKWEDHALEWWEKEAPRM